MKVTVQWRVSPRALGIPRQPGSFSSLDVKDAKKIREEYPDIFESPELDELEKEKPVKIRTRPVK